MTDEEQPTEERVDIELALVPGAIDGEFTPPGTPGRYTVITKNVLFCQTSDETKAIEVFMHIITEVVKHLDENEDRGSEFVGFVSTSESVWAVDGRHEIAMIDGINDAEYLTRRMTEINPSIGETKKGVLDNGTITPVTVN